MLELITYENYKVIDSVTIQLYDRVICRECYVNQGISQLYMNCPEKINVRYLKIMAKDQLILLTKQQHQIYEKCLKTSKNILIDAVCGSGKSNIILRIILEFHSSKKILFICPRRKLVEDFYKTFIKIFDVHPTIITGEQKSEYYSNITLCTSKMLHRLPPIFNMIIFDEVDAFPYYGSEYAQVILQNYVKKANARIIILTATPDKKYPYQIKKIQLKQRYHGYPLPIPKVFEADLLSLHKYINERIFLGENVLLFCANIPIQFELYRYFITRITCFMINSKVPKSKQDKILSIFGSIPSLMITTTLLERGVTYSKVTAIVYQANSNIFDYRVLIQIAGRVNRIANYQSGEVLFISTSQTASMKKAIRNIKNKNRSIK